MYERKWQQRFSLFLGITLSAALGLSLIIPLFQQTPSTSANPTPLATERPEPTVPAPIADVSSITFDRTYFHPSGLFVASIPSGFSVSTETNSTGEAQATLRNPQQLSVIEMRILRPTSDNPVSSVEDLDSFFNNAWLSASWSQYTSWDETNRVTTGDRLVMDFNLVRSRQDYIARQTAFTDGTWVYSVRVVTPSNAASNLRFLLDEQLARFDVVDRFVGAPIEWNAYYDAQADYIVRYPGDWVLEDSAPGQPISITADNAALRIETFADRLPITSDLMARAFIINATEGLEIQSIQEIERAGLSGYSVSYVRQTLDGAPQSGLYNLLNGPNRTLYVANLLVTEEGSVDLNTVNEESTDVTNVLLNIVSVLDTFQAFSLEEATTVAMLNG